MTRDEKLKIFFTGVSIIEIARFCEENGYCVVIASPENFWIEKERGR